MKVKLIRTGGFIPITKTAEAEVDISEDELTSLLATIQSRTDAPRIKDGNYWELSAGSIIAPIDMGKVPDEYISIFEKLKRDLKIVKKD
jgi:hypothetical protein